jgi:hypothetical protein
MAYHDLYYATPFKLWSAALKNWAFKSSAKRVNPV